MVHYIVPPENCDVAERNFCVFVQLLPRSATFTQLWLILGCFAADNLSFWGNLGGKLEPLTTHNLSFAKSVAVCPKIAPSCLHTFFTLDATGLEWLG